MSEKDGKETREVADEIALQARGQLEVGLKWLSEHAAPLAAMIFAISLWHLHNYLEVEGVPVSLASSAMLSTLPAVFVKTTLIVGAVSLSFLLPTLLLLTKIKDDGANLIAALLEERRSNERIAGGDKPTADESHRPALVGPSRGIAVRWVIGFSFYGLLLGAAGFMVSTEQLNENSWLSAGILLAALVISITVFVRIVVGSPLSWRDWRRQTSPDFRMICIAAAFAQLVLAASLVEVTVKVAGQHTDSTWRFFIILAGVLAGLGMVQLFSAIAVHKVRTHRQPAVVALQAGIVLVALSALATQPSSVVVGSMLQVKAPDGKDCVLLVRKSPSLSSGVSGVSVAEMWSSRDVRILLEADGTYYVRPFDIKDRDVALIPKGEVGKLSVCPEKPRT